MLWKTVIIIIFSYFLGCVNTGYYYMKLIYHEDIRTQGTNVTGAFNVSRRAGKKGFLITFFGDALKGAIVVLLCQLLRFSTPIIMISILLVIVGHIFPIQLSFRGGKGLSTAFGAYLVWNPLLIVYLIAIIVVLLPFIRRYTISTQIAFIILPIVLFLIGSPWQTTGFFFVYALLINFACRSNLIEFLEE